MCEAGEEIKVLVLYIGSVRHGQQRSEVCQALEGSGSLLEVKAEVVDFVVFDALHSTALSGLWKIGLYMNPE